jgi:uncharacterized protein (DUF433 family)
LRPLIFGGKPIIRGMRISVELILSLLAQGETVDAITSDYPDLEPSVPPAVSRERWHSRCACVR